MDPVPERGRKRWELLMGGNYTGIDPCLELNLQRPMIRGRDRNNKDRDSLSVEPCQCEPVGGNCVEVDPFVELWLVGIISNSVDNLISGNRVV